MKSWKTITGSLAALVVLFILPISGSRIAAPAAAEYEEDSLEIREATAVLREIVRIPEKGIPPSLLQHAEGIAIIPNVIKVGFVVGGRHGTGVLLIRDRKGKWQTPNSMSLTGGSFGFQIGAQSTDIILVFKTRKSVAGLMSGKFTLGADASIAAGPVGRHAEAATDIQLKAEVFSYSRSRGLFAGVSLEGAVLQVGRRLISPKATAILTDLLDRQTR